MLIEAAIVVGLAAGLALMLTRAFAGLVQGEQVFAMGPALDAVGLDWRVFTFVGAVGAITVVLFGLVPALAASRPGLPGTVARSPRATRGSRRVRGALVCVQLALAVTLLSGAGVLVRTLEHLRGIDLGMNADQVVSFEISAMRLGYTRDQRIALGRDVVDRLQSTPGVHSAAHASPSPFWRGTYPASLKVQLAEEAPEHDVSTMVASADYFQTLGIPIRAGRSFTEAEASRAPSTEGVGIINESLARQLFGETPAVGQRIYLSRAARGWELQRTIAVVGVAGDTRFGADLREPGRPALYEPGATGTSAVFFVRTGLSPSEASAVARAALREIDPTLPLADVGPLSAAVDRLIPEERVLALLVGGIALVALLLGLSGVHAVIAHTVAERTREFGIRLALGATRATVSRGVLRGVAVLAIVGLLCGLALFAGASRWLESRVYGVSALDPMTLASVSVLLIVAAMAGAWLPARRATRVDPAVALRAE
jgi:predicted permease